jgi:hypothetical protein
VRGGVFTERDGKFGFPYLPAGRYSIHVEPLNLQLFSGQFSYDYYRGLTRNFPPTFAGGDASPLIAVAAGERIVLPPIRVESRRAPIQIRYLGVSENGTSFPESGAHPVILRAGESLFLLMEGTGLTPEATVRVTGSDVRLVTRPVRHVSPPHNIPALTALIEARPGAQPGGRNLIVSHAGEVAIYTGAIKVIAPSP